MYCIPEVVWNCHSNGKGTFNNFYVRVSEHHRKKSVGNLEDSGGGL